jgi:hypothetical protein
MALLRKIGKIQRVDGFGGWRKTGRLEGVSLADSAKEKDARSDNRESEPSAPEGKSFVRPPRINDAEIER